MALKRMDNVGIVVEDLDAAIEFFIELGLDLEGRAPIQGEWADGVTGLRDMRVEIAMLRTPDGHGRLELSRFLAPPVVADHRSAPVNSLGYLRVMFAVEDIDDTLARLGKRGAVVVGEVVRYQDAYRLCYIRGPEGILLGLAQQLGQQTSRADPMRQVQASQGGCCSRAIEPRSEFVETTKPPEKDVRRPGALGRRPCSPDIRYGYP